MLSKATNINLHLPTGWNRCTTEELENIAAAIIGEQQRVGRYHPFDWYRVKLNVVLAINDITVLRDNDIPTKDDEIEWLVRRPQDSEPWPITTGQLVSLTERLAWIDDEKISKVIFQFPYPEMTLDVIGKTADHRTIVGPPPLLDGYTWQEYRCMTDWMQSYMRHSNAKNADAAAQAQREFLAILFKPKAGGGHDNDISKHRDNDKIDAAIFEGFDPVKWQVILFWWSSLMSMLAKKFPKVFKQQPVGKGKRRPKQQDTPWDFYNRVTATIQKYIGGLSEQDVNSATYGTILQQLEMMADEAAELERAKSRHP